MHYYQFNIGDYAKATRHLSNLEDLAYRRLMEIYYDTEKPLVNDVDKLARLINMRENKKEIEVVLSDFFTLSDDGFSQKRIDEEIQNYNAKADTARANGKKGGRPKKANWNPEETEQEPKKTKSVILANPEETGSKANQEPITNNQEPITKNQLHIADKPQAKRFAPPTYQEAYDYFGVYAMEKGITISPSEPQSFIDFYQSKNWYVGKNKMKDWKASVRNWFKNIEQRQAKRPMRQDVNFIDHTLPEGFKF
jgi:uncharacterized protein YdaU (DUF1376 family)